MASRKVKFFRATDADGTLYPGGFPAADITRLIGEMAKGGTAEIPLGLGLRLVAKGLGKKACGHHVVLYRVSHNDLPLLYENGEFRPLEDVISSGADIAEPAHFAFFPDDIVANLYNHNGPKQVQLASYLLTTMNLDVLFMPIAREDIIESIANAGGVQLFSLRVKVEDLQRFDGMSLGGMKALGEDFPVGTVEIILRATNPDQKRRLGRVIQRTAGQLQSNRRAKYVDKARVKLTDADALSDGREVNLIEDLIVLTQHVDTVPGNRRYVEEASAVDALEDAYRRVQGRF